MERHYKHKAFTGCEKFALGPWLNFAQTGKMAVSQVKYRSKLVIL
jgi:hypothetical protein